MSLLQRRKNLPPLQISRPTQREALDEECLKRYEILNLLGQGSAGRRVYRAQRKTDQRKVALKITEAPDLEATELRRTEFQVLQQVSHPNIVEALDARLQEVSAASEQEDFFASNGRAVLVMSYHSGQTLRSLIKHSGSLPEAVGQRLFSKLMSAVDYLHSRRIIHRDITANNVIVSEDRIDVHLLDFNAAKALTEGGALTLTGTMDYNPPEVLNGDSSSEKHDIWSAGLCLHLMMLGSLPHKRSAFPSDEAFREVVSSSPMRCVGPRYSGISEPCKAMMRQCLAIEKEARPAAMFLLQMEWLDTDLDGPKISASKVRTLTQTSGPSLMSPCFRRASLPPRLTVAACGIGGIGGCERHQTQATTWTPCTECA